MSEFTPRKICLTYLLDLNTERSDLGLKPMSPKDWAEGLERSIDTVTRRMLPSAETDAPMEVGASGSRTDDQL